MKWDLKWYYWRQSDTFTNTWYFYNAIISDEIVFSITGSIDISLPIVDTYFLL